MTTLTEVFQDGGFLVAELPGLASRRAGTLASGQNLNAGAVVSRVLTLGAATVVSSTGNGTVTVNAAVGEDAVEGVYRLLCVAAAANAGTFNLNAPDGSLIRQITVGGGAHASTHLSITIADGATDFIVGDNYTIAVTAGNYTVLAPAATDGTQIARGVLLEAVNATAAARPCVAVYKEAVLNSAEIVWPAGITSPQQTIATSQLADVGIILR